MKTNNDKQLNLKGAVLDLNDIKVLGGELHRGSSGHLGHSQCTHMLSLGNKENDNYYNDNDCNAENDKPRLLYGSKKT